MNEVADPALPTRARTNERTFVLGYLAGATVAWVTFMVGAMAWSGNFVSRYDLGLWSVIAMFAVPITWIALAVPFVLVRWVAGARTFSSAGRAAALGAVTGILSIPFAVEMGRIFDLEGPRRPFLTDLVGGAMPDWPLYAGAGAVGGLAYWLLEFSSFPAAIVLLPGDARSLRWTDGLLSRRAAAAIALVLALGAVVPTAEWWWKPHVHQPPGTGVPPVAFEDEWGTRSWTGFLTWSADGARVISLSANGAWLAVRDRESGAYQERKVPQVDVTHAVGDQRLVVAPEEFGTRNAFYAVGVETGEVLHEESDPAPGTAGLAGAAVRLALSPDGTTLAVGYGYPRSGLPVSLFSTQDWRRVSTIDPLLDRRQGVSLVAFSNDGTRLAIGTLRELLVCDVRTGAVLHRIPVWPYAVSFSPDGRMLAVVGKWSGSPSGTSRQVVRVIRLSDGVEVASREAGSGPNASALWDPRGRFVVFAVGGADTVHLWNPSAPALKDVAIQLRRFSGGLALSPDGSRLAVGNGDVVSIFKVSE